MHQLTIIWSLFCASLIIGYPIYLYHKSLDFLHKVKKAKSSRVNNYVELLSFDLASQLPSWSISLNVPQITDEVLGYCPILFYLESEDGHLKLPLNNIAQDYTAQVYKNTGKVYVTFKCLKDGVSNYHVPAWHAKTLKIIIIKPSQANVLERNGKESFKTRTHKSLLSAGVNLANYESVLSYYNSLKQSADSSNSKSSAAMLTKFTQVVS